ncbi:hypothetical protein QFZ62_002004 [Clavibacter sp. B3I6]|nr:hypothetical protein [Clavibacter sp. B3I6]
MTRRMADPSFRAEQEAQAATAPIGSHVHVDGSLSGGSAR